MPILKIILIIILILIAFAIIVGIILTAKTQSAPEQAEFLKGALPEPLPHGFWPGSTNLPHGDWQGKQFNAAAKTGVNLFGADHIERAPFTLSTGLALHDKNLQVLKIDYNRPENPWYLRLALDEVVQTQPNKLLGKIHIRLFGGAISIGYFTQSK